MSLPLPREHGTWAILLIPFLTATAIAGIFSPAVGVALLAVLLTFLVRAPLEAWLLPGSERRPVTVSPAQARRWAAIYGTAAALSGLALIIIWQRAQLVAVAALALMFLALHVREVRRGAVLSWTAEGLGTLALTLSAPVAWIAATGGINATGLLVWLLNAAFFTAGLIYVKLRIRALAAAHKPGAVPPASGARQVLQFHLAVVLLVAGLVLGHWASPLVLLPFLLATARAGWGARRFGQRFSVRGLGWSEVAHSLVFGVLLVVAFRPWG